MASRPQRRKPENRNLERIEQVAKEADPGSVLEGWEMGRMGRPNVRLQSSREKSCGSVNRASCMLHSRKAHSKPLPDNNSKHEPLKFVSGVGCHPCSRWVQSLPGIDPRLSPPVSRRWLGKPGTCPCTG